LIVVGAFVSRPDVRLGNTHVIHTSVIVRASIIGIAGSIGSDEGLTLIANARRRKWIAKIKGVPLRSTYLSRAHTLNTITCVIQLLFYLSLRFGLFHSLDYIQLSWEMRILQWKAKGAYNQGQ